MRLQLNFKLNGQKTARVIEPGRNISIGRSHTCDIVIEDEHASRRHVLLDFTGDGWHLTDLNSSNGTRVDGEPVRDRITIGAGQEILIGATRIELSLPESVAAHEPTIDFRENVESKLATTLASDDMEALVGFMSGASSESESKNIVKMALDTLRKRTDANVVGFSTVEESEKPDVVVRPKNGQLSRTFVTQTSQAKETLWLDTCKDPPQSDSIKVHRDAIGLAIRDGRGMPRAIVHLYKQVDRFRSRDVQFAEALVNFLTPLLNSRTGSPTRSDDAAAPFFGELIGDSEPMQKLREQIASVAKSKFNLLILGQTGTGKNIVARMVHDQSGRTGNYVEVNCTDNDSTLERTLFSPNGAMKKARGGTLVLNEVSGLSPSFQLKLRHLLENRLYTVQGGTRTQPLDVRIITTSNQDLAKLVKEDRFRSDLFYRIEELSIELPALSDRMQDLELLVQHFLELMYSERHRNVKIHSSVWDKLRGYTWPGNVLELRNELLQAVLRMSEKEAVLNADHFQLGRSMAAMALPPLHIDEYMRTHAIPRALEMTNGNRTDAARLLGVTRQTLMNWLDRFNMRKDKKRRRS